MSDLTPQQAHDEMRNRQINGKRTTKALREKVSEAVVIVGTGEADLQEFSVNAAHPATLFFMSDGTVRWGNSTLMREMHE